MVWWRCYMEIKVFKEVLGCPLAASLWNPISWEPVLAIPEAFFPLVLPLHPVPVLLSSAAHLSLPLCSLGKSVEITFHYLAPQGSSGVPTLDCFCPGRRNGFSKFFHFPFAIFPVRYLARSVHKCRKRSDAVPSHCLGEAAEVTLAEGHSPKLALKFSPWSLEISLSFSEHGHVSHNIKLGSHCSSWVLVYFLSTA